MASLFAAAHGLALQDGLVTPHAYSLLSVKEVGGLRMVCLRNPWGRGGGKEWLGGWKDGAQETFGGGGVNRRATPPMVALRFKLLFPECAAKGSRSKSGGLGAGPLFASSVSSGRRRIVVGSSSGR